MELKIKEQTRCWLDTYMIEDYTILEVHESNESKFVVDVDNEVVLANKK